MQVVKLMIKYCYWLAVLACLVVGGLLLWRQQWSAMGLWVASVPMVVNAICPFDQLLSVNGKLRQPLLSLGLMCGLAWVMVSIHEVGLSLWLMLLLVFTFFLYTYWAKAPVNKNVS